MAKFNSAKSATDLKMLDWQDSVIDKDLTAPPGGESAGDRYLVGGSATGAWAGHDNDIAQFNGSTWIFTTPNEGFACWVEDENKIYTYNGSAWVVISATPGQHDIDDPVAHAGVTGATENNLVAFDSNGLPKDSGSNPTDFATPSELDPKLDKIIISKLKILGNNDDGEEDYDASWYPNGFGSNQISVGNDNTGSCDAGLRFLRAFIPNNAKVTSAILRVKAAVNSTKRPTLKIRGILEASPDAFAGDGSDRPSTRNKTTAAVDWDIAEDWVLNTWYESPDIASVINEIIQQSEFDGKALALSMEDDASPANQYENIWDFNSGAANAAELLLTIEPNVI